MSVRQTINKNDLRDAIALLEKDVRIYTTWARLLSVTNEGGLCDHDIAFLRGLASEHDELAVRLKASGEEDDPPPDEASSVPLVPQPDKPTGEMQKEVTA